MATYYFYLDAVGLSDGSDETNAYDGVTVATLPDGTSAACRLDDVIGALQSGDILYVKKSTSAITWHNSETTAAQSTDGPTNFVDGGTSYGQVRIIGYETTETDGGRPDVDMGSKVWYFRRRCGSVKNFNFTGTYTGAGMIRLDEGAIMSNCRVENTNTATNAIAVSVESFGIADRCEIIGSQDIASPSTYQNATVSMYPQGNSTLTNCYIEARNGGFGVFGRRRSGSFIVSGNVINVNRDVDGSGNTSGDGIHLESYAYYMGGNIINNIIHNANNGIYMDRSGTDDRSNGRIFGNVISSCINGIEGDIFYNSKNNALDTNTIDDPIVSYNNFYYNNTTTDSFLNHEHNATVLSTDPFADTANRDFSITGSEVLSNFGYASSFTQAGASGDTTTSNALIPIKPAVAGAAAVERGTAF